MYHPGALALETSIPLRRVESRNILKDMIWTIYLLWFTCVTQMWYVGFLMLVIRNDYFSLYMEWKTWTTKQKKLAFVIWIALSQLMWGQRWVSYSLRSGLNIYQPYIMLPLQYLHISLTREKEQRRGLREPSSNTPAIYFIYCSLLEPCMAGNDPKVEG